MKKLKLTALQLGAQEVLSRAQLKNILGGSGSGSGSGSGGLGSCVDECSSKPCPTGKTCTTIPCSSENKTIKICI